MECGQQSFLFGKIGKIHGHTWQIMALLLGFRIISVFSLLLALVVASSIAWLFYTRLGSITDKFDATFDQTNGKYPERARPNSGINGRARAHLFESQYENLKWDLLDSWEHDAKPVLLGCCIVVGVCACLQGLVSLIGVASGCVQIRARVKLWLIVHFILFFAYILCILTLYISNMNRPPPEKWDMKVLRVQAAAKRVAHLRPGPGTDPEGQTRAIEWYIKSSAKLFYGLATGNAALVLLLFFALIWVMKEDHSVYKYHKVSQ